jgi:hypothetical protein
MSDDQYTESVRVRRFEISDLSIASNCAQVILNFPNSWKNRVTGGCLESRKSRRQETRGTFTLLGLSQLRANRR